MARLLPEQAAALRVLAPYAEVASPVCEVIADGRVRGTIDVRRLCTLAGLSQGQGGAVTKFLEVASQLGATQKSGELHWTFTNRVLLTSLAPMLQAIHFYRTNIHQDANTVEVVLTKPPKPSELTKRLESMLMGTWGMYETRGMLPAIAEKASHQFVVMTPFLDKYGAKILVDLYKNTSCPKRCLVLRQKTNGQWPEGYLAEKDELRQLGVEVYNFRLEKIEDAGMETFHAKVVLADRSCAYVGSSNLNQWSFKYSFELGLMVSGTAAARIADIIDAVISISTPVE